jgi:hypothetical protein
MLGSGYRYDFRVDRNAARWFGGRAAPESNTFTLSAVISTEVEKSLTIFRLWDAITVSGFISSQTVIILFCTSVSLIPCRVETGSTGKASALFFLLHIAARS